MQPDGADPVGRLGPPRVVTGVQSGPAVGEQREFQRCLGGPVRAAGVGDGGGTGAVVTGRERVEAVEVAADPAEGAGGELLQVVARTADGGCGGCGGAPGGGGPGTRAEAGCRRHSRPVSSR